LFGFRDGLGTLGRFSAFDHYPRLNSQTGEQTFDLILRFGHQRGDQIAVEVLGGSGFGGMDDVEDDQLGLVFRRKTGRPLEGGVALRTEVDGAEDLAEGDLFEGRCVFEMDAGPYGAIGIVQDLGGERTEDEAAEGAESVGGHHDQVGAVLPGMFDDLQCRNAFEDQAVDFEVLEFFGEIRAHSLMGGIEGGLIVLDEGEPAEIRGAEEEVILADDVEKRDFGLKAAGDVLDIAGRAEAAFGEVDREEDLADLEHGR
jgi:hypothetical protein